MPNPNPYVAEVVVSPISPMAVKFLNLKCQGEAGEGEGEGGEGEQEEEGEMPSHATADPDAAPRPGRSTTTNSVKVNPTNATTKAG